MRENAPRCAICGAKMKGGVPIESTAHRKCVAEPEKDRRSSSIIAAAIQSASLTPHEEGQILGAIIGRICWMAQTEPEFEEVAHDLSDAWEKWLQAEDAREDRLYMEHKRG